MVVKDVMDCMARPIPTRIAGLAWMVTVVPAIAGRGKGAGITAHAPPALVQ